MQRKISLALIIAVYSASLFYTFFKINPTYFEFFQQPAFVVGTSFFSGLAKIPGGLGYWISLFAEVLFRWQFMASVLMVIVVLLSGWLSARIVKKISAENVITQTIAWLLPILISAVLWLNVRFAFSINIHLLLTLAALNAALFFIGKKYCIAVNILITTAVYFICGAMWLYTFTISLVIASLAIGGRQNMKISAAYVVFASLCPAIFYFLLPLTPKQAFYNFVPQQPVHIQYSPTWHTFLIFIYLPIILTVAYTTKNRTLKTKASYLVLSSCLLCLGFGTYKMVSKLDNRTMRVRMATQIAAYNSDWQKVISLSKKCGQYDRYINFFYNIAISKTRQMGERLFSYPQLLGVEGLFMDEPLAGEICTQSSYLYKHLGMINIALRFAYEAETTLPNSPYIIRHIIDCLIIKGDYQIAEMYLKKLDKTLFQHDFVNDRRNFIAGKHGTKLKADDISSVRQKMPDNPFIYTQNYQNNMLQLISHDTSNLMAYDYLLSVCLMKRRLPQFYHYLADSPHIDMKKLPKTYQEALMIYLTNPKNKDRDEILKNTNLDQQLISDFKYFSEYVSKQRDKARAAMDRRFPGSYWVYYLFDNPDVTKASIKQIQK